MIDFIVNNYQLLILLLASLLDIVLFLVGIFNKKENPVLNILADMLPGFIKDAEVYYGSGKGEEKLSYVLHRVEEYYKKLTGCELHLTGTLYRSFVNRIENILGTPQKKGK